MRRVMNEMFEISIDDQGTVRELYLRQDPEGMNWVIDPDYLQSVGYPDEDKCFGRFILETNGHHYTLDDVEPVFTDEEDSVTVSYPFGEVQVHQCYSLSDSSSLQYTIRLSNQGSSRVAIDRFEVWLSLAYVMFRDLKVKRNMTQSCAVFPSISPDFSRFAAVRRSNRGPHLGIFNTEGRTLSLGTYCRFENRFLEQVSPSLDGLLFHNLILAGKPDKSEELVDWMYPNVLPLIIEAGEVVSWTYVFRPYEEEEDFAEMGRQLGFPAVDYSPVLVQGGLFTAEIRLPEGENVARLMLTYVSGGELRSEDVTSLAVKNSEGVHVLKRMMNEPGEYKLSIHLRDGREDIVIFSVLEPIHEIIEARVRYLCEHAFNDAEGAEHRYAFEPVSNQGESLGKLSMILMKNLLGNRVLSEIHKVEQSAVHYVKPRWFANGDFRKPKKLYGSFYRIFDFDYIAHVYYLLSRFPSSELQIHSPTTYLQWAGELMIVRFDEQLHADEREQKETKLTGVFTLFLQDLLHDLRREGEENSETARIHDRLSELVERFSAELVEGTSQYLGAITEHYYDNAGFGPSCEALCLAGETASAELYGELLLANIGFSNDYRAQNPDRWWEALSYMLHSLWGGLVASNCLTAYEYFRKTPYLQKAYRSMMAIFSCYDWNIVSTVKRLRKGEAASTYCVASPNINKPYLSRNRFGQSVFQEDFELLAGNATGDDWDMGEEIAAYLKGFGTKTFLYYDAAGEVRCINGDIREVDGQTIVVSYAAYPKAYYFYDNQDVLIAEDDEGIIRSIALDSDHRMRRRESTTKEDLFNG